MLDKGYEFPEEQGESGQSGLAWSNPLQREEAEERMEKTRRRGKLLNKKMRVRGDDESRQHSQKRAARRK